jgi:hypothetical protein
MIRDDGRLERSPMNERDLAVYATILVAAGATAIAACAPPIVIGSLSRGTAGGPNGGAMASSAGGSMSTGVATQSPTALALMTGELPANAMPCGYNNCAPPTDMLFVEIASLGNTCQQPRGAEMIWDSTCDSPAPGSPNYWQLQIGLPAEDQAVGTYPLMDPAIYYESTYQSLQPSSGSKGVGSGVPGAGRGTLEVLSIDKTQITVRLTGVGLNVPMNGDYVAARCTPLP